MTMKEAISETLEMFSDEWYVSFNMNYTRYQTGSTDVECRIYWVHQDDNSNGESVTGRTWRQTVDAVREARKRVAA